MITFLFWLAVIIAAIAIIVKISVAMDLKDDTYD